MEFGIFLFGISTFGVQNFISMATYQTPGVYIEEVSRFPPSVAEVDTAIPAFIGYTQKAHNLLADDLLLVPTRIRSFIEFKHYFGEAPVETGIVVQLNETAAGVEIIASNTKPAVFQLYYSLQLYFANGGGDCYIISVGNYQQTKIDAASLEQGMIKAGTVDPVTLIVFPDALNLSDAVSYYDLQVKTVKQCNMLRDRFAIMDVYRSQADWQQDVTLFRNSMATASDALKFGAAYFPMLSSTIDFNSSDETLVTISSTNAARFGNNLALLKQNDSALYKQVKQHIMDIPMVLPAAPAIAGVYASMDRSRGVWKAPANTNLNSVINPTVTITNNEQDNLNVDTNRGISINTIRSFPGRGPAIVWGARTLMGNDNEWRYVSARRFFNMVEESVKQSTTWVVFEPNDVNTWVKVQAMIENFLTNLWRAGALQGAKPEHAYYVSVGLNKTMTSLDILEGRLIVEIGMAAVRPAEFIIVRVSHKLVQA